jgi:hypothetical protein
MHCMLSSSLRSLFLPYVLVLRLFYLIFFVFLLCKRPYYAFTLPRLCRISLYPPSILTYHSGHFEVDGIVAELRFGSPDWGLQGTNKS